jgi:uncharacterized DUF497 family protein
MPKPPPGFEWDERKALWNRRVHGVSFAEAVRFDMSSVIELEGHNDEIDEARITALGKIGKTLHVLVYARRAGNIRIISLRKATAKERRIYVEAKGY